MKASAFCHGTFSRFLFAFFIALIFLTALLLLPAKADPALPAISLTVTGINGSSKVFNQADLSAMPETVGQGGFWGDNNCTYSGVNVTYLCNLVGGFTSHSTIRLISGTDGYITYLTYTGDGSVYCSSSHGVVFTILPPGQSIILAYYNNSGNGNQLLQYGGPLRSAVIGSQSDSFIWNQNVTEVQVVGGATSLTLSLLKKTAETAQSGNLTLTGALTTADTGPVEGSYAVGTGVSGKLVTIYQSNASSSWAEIGQALTQANGVYLFNWAPNSTVAAESYQFKAVFNTDSDYFGSSTQTSSSPEASATPEYPIVAVSIFTICFASLVTCLGFKKHGLKQAHEQKGSIQQV